MTQKTPLSSTVLLVAALLLAGAAGVACSRAEAKPVVTQTDAPVAVETVEVVEKKLPSTLLLTGSLAPNRSSDVAAEGAGKVIKTYVERGDRVEKGAIIAKLDARDAALAAAEAGAAASAERARERHAKLECERADKLFVQGAISRAELDRAKASCETATASASAARARTARAGKAIGDAYIRAPFSGVIVERFAEVGEYVFPGAKIAHLVEPAPMRLELSVPESVVGKLATGQRLEFSVASEPGKTYAAVIRFIGPVLERQSRNLPVEAIVESPGDQLKPGMFATTRLVLGERSGLAVPARAIAGTASSPRAFVVTNGRVEERVLRVGDSATGWTAVLKGLAKGERIVAAPTPAIRDGIRVN